MSDKPTTPEELADQLYDMIGFVPWRVKAAALIAEAFERRDPHRLHDELTSKTRALADALARAEKAEARVRELEASCDGCAYDDSEECTDCRRRRRTDYYRAIEEARAATLNNAIGKFTDPIPDSPKEWAKGDKE